MTVPLHPFENPKIAWFQIATQHPTHAIVCHNASGQFQIYAWDMQSHQLNQLTHHENGAQLGAMSADGMSVYYLEDVQGGQIGHFFKVNFDGTNRYDLTPDWVAYTSFYITESYSGNFYGFMTANQHGFQMFVVDSKTSATPHLRYESEVFSVGAFLSHDAELTVIATADHEPDTLHFSLESYDTKTGQRLHTLWDGLGSHIQPIGFINRAFDMRFLATTDVSGWIQPFIWNARTGDRKTLMLDTLQGDVVPLDWSVDGERLLLAQTHAGVQKLWVYAVKTQELQALDSHGQVVHQAIWQGDSLYTLAETPTQPPHILKDNIPVLQLPQAQLSAQPTQGHLLVMSSAQETPLKEAYSASRLAWQADGWMLDYVRLNKQPRQSNAWQTELNTIQQTLIFKDELPHVLMGISYGGYLALMTLLKQTHGFKGGIVINPIVDWVSTYEVSEPQERQKIIELFGGTPEEFPERYQQASPITHIHELTQPLLLIQSSNDYLSPIEPIQRFLERCAYHNKRVQIQWVDTNNTSEQHSWMRSWVLKIIK
jgi:hypothetical protein